MSLPARSLPPARKLLSSSTPPAAFCCAPNLEELRTFCVAAELGALGRAASRLHVTQPAISNRLRSLEEHCGVRLFDRAGRASRSRRPGASTRMPAASSSRWPTWPGRSSSCAAAPRRSRWPSARRRRTSCSPLPSCACSARPMPVEVIIANSRTVKRMVAAGEGDLVVAAFTLDEAMKIPRSSRCSTTRSSSPFRCRTRGRVPGTSARAGSSRRRSSAAIPTHRRARSSTARCAPRVTACRPRRSRSAPPKPPSGRPTSAALPAPADRLLAALRGVAAQRCQMLRAAAVTRRATAAEMG